MSEIEKFEIQVDGEPIEVQPLIDDNGTSFIVKLPTGIYKFIADGSGELVAVELGDLGEAFASKVARSIENHFS